MSGLQFHVHIDTSDIKRRFEEIGSREHKRAVQFALDETAKAAKGRFVERIPGALDHGPRAGRPSRLTLDPISYERNRDYDSYGGSGGRDPSSSIVVKPLQSKWLKYLFGDAANERMAGDVGLAADRLLIPNGSNLYFQAGIKTPGYGRTMGGLPPDAMASLKGLVAAADAGTSKGGIKAALRRMASQSRAGNGLGASRPGSPSPHAQVYRAPDRVTGLPTYYARPGRVRDPAGGKHLAWTRPDGTRVMMPDTIRYLRRGKAGMRTGAGVGPARLFAAIERATYRPSLERPWIESATEAYALFERFLDREFEGRIERRAQGRRY